MLDSSDIVRKENNKMRWQDRLKATWPLIVVGAFVIGVCILQIVRG